MKKVLKWVAIVFVGLIILGAIIGGGDDSQDLGSGTVKEDTQEVSQTNAPEETKEPEKPALELLDHEYVQEDFVDYIVGTIINNTDKEYSYVQVEINLYDEDDTLLGSTLANVNNLGANEKWKFKAIVTEDNVAKYKIKDITGF